MELFRAGQLFDRYRATLIIVYRSGAGGLAVPNGELAVERSKTTGYRQFEASVAGI